MKYPNIKALVPAAEHFDESAIVNEGGYLSTAHLDAVEAELTQSYATHTNLQNELTTAQGNATTLQTTIDGLNTNITGLNDAAAISATTISTQATRIQALEAQVKDLGGESSGSGTVLPVKKDEVVKEKTEATNGFARFDSEDHPANRAAMRRGISLSKKED